MTDKQVAKWRERQRIKWWKEHRKQNPEAGAAHKAAKKAFKAKARGGKNSEHSQMIRDYNKRNADRYKKRQSLTPEQRTRLDAEEARLREAHYKKVYSLRKQRRALNPWETNSWLTDGYNKAEADKYIIAVDASKAHGQSRRSAIWDGAELNEAAKKIINAPSSVTRAPIIKAVGKQTNLDSQARGISRINEAKERQRVKGIDRAKSRIRT
jgi:hypothetical protein